MPVDLIEANLIVYDPANKRIQGYTASKSVNLNLFTRPETAFWKSDRLLKTASYPLAQFQFVTNRKLFKLQAGDLFNFSYTNWGITNMICRVVKISEKELGSEEIDVVALEDVDYISSTIATSEITPPTSQWDTPTDSLGDLTALTVVEPPYLIAGGDYVKMLPLAAMRTGGEVGYEVYQSIDSGTSYSKIDTVTAFNPFGVLLNSYDVTPDIDKRVGLTVYFTSGDEGVIGNITMSELFGTLNMAILGETEWITFQTISLVSDTTYKLEGVHRGFAGTEKTYHPPGTTFFFVGDNFRQLITFGDEPTGATRLYKFLPISSGATLDIALVDNPVTYTFTGFARKPYPVHDFRSNDSNLYSKYTGDNVLTWAPRYRGIGAGMGIPTSVTDASPTHEGFFRVRVYAHTTKTGTQTLVRTTSGLTTYTWTYDSTMNTADNGSLSPFLTFAVTNYRTDGSIEYESISRIILVTKG
ncbi:MAG: hypothetical protein DRQ42_00160 [Gammaproteobacteria bacterium]|nr:MAG: hypothetical protein DRQ42_00160 [Gammaproteobacteria bacterium]